MVIRTIEMREIGFSVPKDEHSEIIQKITNMNIGDFEITEEGEMIWVKGDLHNKYKRRKILFILSGGKIGENV